MAILFVSVFTKGYYSPLFSLSSCVCLAILIFVIVIPFFAAISSDGFWTFYQTYSEKPSIAFNNELIMYVLEDETPKYYSSISDVNLYFTSTLISPSLKITNNDLNNDGIIDSVRITISFPMNPVNIKNIKMLLFFDYILQKYVKLEMKTMAYVDLDILYGASYIYLNGDLNLKQSSPIAYGSIPRTIYNTSIFDNYTSPYDLISIYEKFNNRNLTTNFIYDKYIYPSMYTNEVVLDLVINYPSYQNVLAISNHLIVLQNAWIQYFCIFIFVATVIYHLTFYTFKNQIFQTSVIEDLPNYNPLKSRQ